MNVKGAELVVEKITKARALIADPLQWCRYAYARDRYGSPAYPYSIEARQWCSLGSLERVTRDAPSRILVAGKVILEEALGQLGYGHEVGAFNDSHTHEEVLEMFDKAIEIAKERVITI